MSCEELVKALVGACQHEGGDQVQWLLVGENGQKIVVLVTMTDPTSERLLEFVDGQLDSGLMRRRD